MEVVVQEEGEGNTDQQKHIGIRNKQKSFFFDTARDNFVPRCRIQ